MEQRDFFISYTNADEAWAVWIANVLKSNGYTAYVQALDIKPGDIFPEKMNEFLKSSANFIAVWSARYFASQFCKDELNGAYIQRNKGQMKYLFLVRIDNYPIEPLYAGLVHIALPDRGAASETKLIDAVRHAVSPPLTPTVPRPIAPTDTFPDTYPVSLIELQTSPTQEDAETLYQRGEDYYYGRNGVKQDYFKARDYYERAAAKGSAYALNSLGELYNHGLGVAQNYAKALEYFQKALDGGYTPAIWDVYALRAKVHSQNK